MFLNAVVRGGKIVDQGSHADLVKRGGFYASMVARQAMHPEQSDTNDDNVPAVCVAIISISIVILSEEMVESLAYDKELLNLCGICGVQEGVTSVKKPLKKMRDSVLTRASVRLSIIPQDIAQKLRRKPQVYHSMKAFAQPHAQPHNLTTSHPTRMLCVCAGPREK